MTALQAFDLTTHGGRTDFVQVATLCDRFAPWCVVGGLAVNCYVEPVHTLDAGIVLVAENLLSVQSELQAAGFNLTRFEHSLNVTRRQ